MKNEEVKSIEKAIKLFQKDLIDPHKSYVTPSYARYEIERLRNLILVSI